MGWLLLSSENTMGYGYEARGGGDMGRKVFLINGAKFTLAGGKQGWAQR
jgi:hypothetical protein